MGQEVSYSGHRDVWGPVVNEKYKELQNVAYHFEKKNSKIFFVWEPRENVSQGPVVALDGLE